MRPPTRSDLFQLSLCGRAGETQRLGGRNGQRPVPAGPDVGSAERAHEEDVGGPRPDPGNPGERRPHSGVIESGELVEVDPFVAHPASQFADVAGLLAAESDPAQVIVGHGEDLLRLDSHRLSETIEGGSG